MMERFNDTWENNAGLVGWGVVFATVVALDIALPQTLSSAADRLLENPRTRALPWVLGGIIAGHCLNIIPQKFDPIQRAGDYVYQRWMQ